MDDNFVEKEIIKLLKESKTIAIVGLSAESEKDSYHVAEFLQQHGYKIIPVNPKYSEILGEKSYTSLAEIPDSIDIVDVFRRSDFILPIAKETLQLKSKPKAFWMQLGITHAEAKEILEKNEIKVIQDECIKIVYAKLLS